MEQLGAALAKPSWFSSVSVHDLNTVTHSDVSSEKMLSHISICDPEFYKGAAAEEERRWNWSGEPVEAAGDWTDGISHQNQTGFCFYLFSSCKEQTEESQSLRNHCCSWFQFEQYNSRDTSSWFHPSGLSLHKQVQCLLHYMICNERRLSAANIIPSSTSSCGLVMSMK